MTSGPRLVLALLMALHLVCLGYSWLPRGAAAAAAFFLSSSWLDLGVFDASWLAEPPSTTFTRNDLVRLDESPDGLFYRTPRFVEHIDSSAVASLTDFHASLIRDIAAAQSGAPVRVLDLCSSWTSHIPPSSTRLIGEAVGLGMNKEELDGNPMLTRRVVQDLNENPHLPFENGQFDLVLLQLSIDYLTRPVDVLVEVGRVLRPSGKVAITFSNRLFLTKTVGYWSGKPDIEHVEAVGDALRATNGIFEMPPEGLDLHPKGRDPLFAVLATSSRQK